MNFQLEARALRSEPLVCVFSKARAAWRIRPAARDFYSSIQNVTVNCHPLCDDDPADQKRSGFKLTHLNSLAHLTTDTRKKNIVAMCFWLLVLDLQT